MKSSRQEGSRPVAAYLIDQINHCHQANIGEVARNQAAAGLNPARLHTKHPLPAGDCLP